MLWPRGCGLVDITSASRLLMVDTAVPSASEGGRTRQFDWTGEIWGSHGAAVKMPTLAFWAVTPCGFVVRHQIFEEHTASIFSAAWEIPTFRKSIMPPSSELPWRRWLYVPPKRRYIPLSPHGETTQKNNTDSTGFLDRSESARGLIHANCLYRPTHCRGYNY
jgi:hypothetical protein